MGGGGGRIFVGYDTLGAAGNDLDGLRNITAFGGHGNSSWGSAGTVVLKQSAQVHGDLVIDDNRSGQTSSVRTPLTPVGPGTIQGLTADTLVLDGGVTLLPGGLAGLELNPNLSQAMTFTIVDNTATTVTVDISGGTLLTDVAATGDVYAAVYRVDNLRFRRGGFLAVSDRLLVNDTLHLSEYGVLTHPDTTLTFEPRLDIEAGTVQIDTNGMIDVTARGYLGGLHAENAGITSGRTLDNALGSTPRSGGSYAGLGGAVASGVPNSVYGSATLPLDLGSGGSDGIGSPTGGDGGGRIRLLAGNMVVDGAIRAQGGIGAGNQAGSGSGGSILIEAGALSGIGSITADGGAHEVGGGGGRIAIY